MTTIPIRDSLDASRLTTLDELAIQKYNETASAQFRLHPELGPSAFEGDIDNATVVLLLANPGFDATTTMSDHAFSRPDWPLAGLHPGAPDGLRNWWTARLGQLISTFGRQHVARKVACLQLTPWASSGFDSALRLPSRQLLLEAATAAASRGALLIVMRGERLWLEAKGLESYPGRFRVRSWRCSYVSEGNLGANAWQRVRESVGGAQYAN